MNPFDYEYVSFASAGTKGHMFLGLLDGIEYILEKQGRTYDEWHASLKGVSGTSAGSMIGLVLLLGINKEKRSLLLSEISDVLKHLNPDLSLLLRNYGWEDGRSIKNVIRRFLSLGGLSEESTLYDMYRIMRKEFVCVCTNLNLCEKMRLSAKSHPDMKVVDAIYASCAVPFVFTPPMIDTIMVADGCLTENMPLVFDESKTLFVIPDRRVINEAVHTWPDFLAKIVRCSSANQDFLYKELSSRVSGFINIKCTDDVLRMPSLNFNQTSDETLVVYRLGYISVLHSLDATLLKQIGTLVSMLVGIIKTCPSEQPPIGECLSSERQAGS
tara:strand:- start:6103 stop:7086 length:984 start_codon:yes stop_codon:yes gene_type:complete